MEKLSRGQVTEAMQKRDADGLLHEILDRDGRIATIAHEYAKQPRGTLVVSSDNQSSMAINQAIHYAMQDTNQMLYREHRMRALVARQGITGADRQWAALYERGNVVRYAKGSKTLGITRRGYTRVKCVDGKQNHVTVDRKNGQRLSHHSCRLQTDRYNGL